MISLSNQMDERQVKMVMEKDNIMRFLIDQTLTAQSPSTQETPSVSLDPSAAGSD